MTPKDIFENQIAKRAPEVNHIDAVFQFNITGDDGGQWVVDLTEGKVHEGTADSPDCTIKVSDENFVKMVKGEVPGPQLFMTGQLEIAGNMGLALKLGEVLGNR